MPEREKRGDEGIPSQGEKAPLSGASGQSKAVLDSEQLWWRRSWTAPQVGGSPGPGFQMEDAQGPSTVVMTLALHLHLVVRKVERGWPCRVRDRRWGSSFCECHRFLRDSHGARSGCGPPAVITGQPSG